MQYRKEQRTASKNHMKESEIEKFFSREMHKRGAIVYKFISPNRRGVPDRIFITKKGNLFFVEFKARQGRYSALQERELQRLLAHNQMAFRVRGHEEAVELLEVLRDM